MDRMTFGPQAVASTVQSESEIEQDFKFSTGMKDLTYKMDERWNQIQKSMEKMEQALQEL